MPAWHETMPPSKAKESLESRRARGEISCAECRRHKLKCDRNIPCSTCVRKGCESICPNGVQPPVISPRISVTDTDARKPRVAEMTKRIRQLEDALQIAHSSVSNAPHPLLARDLLAIKNSVTQPIEPKSETESIDSELLEPFGTLSVTKSGTESYFAGPNALLAKYLGAEFNVGSGFGSSNPSLPAPMSYLSKAFPFTPLYLPAQEIQAHVEEMLPSYARASALAEAYLENVSWFFRPVDREQIMEELIPVVYRRKWQTSGASSSSSSPSSTPNDQAPAEPHALALLLAVSAVGAAADLTLPPWNDEADLYHHLARTALSLQPVFEGAGLHAVQAIALLAAYDLFACRRNDLEETWKIMTFGLSLAASIGLNRDPSHFKLPPKLIQRRRRVFWELYSVDIWKTTASGRPLTFTSDVIDCEFPEDTDAREMPSSIWHIRQHFVKEIMSELVTKLCVIRSVKYSEILALDQKIREYDPHGFFTLAARSYDLQRHGDNQSNSIRQAQLGLLKDITLLILHRAFFARALIEDPVNPIRTQFGPSYLSSYRSAVSLLQTAQEVFEHSPHYLLRIWPIWAHALSASVMLGSIAARGSAAALAPQAYVHFSLAYNMFTKVQMHPLVKSGLPSLTQLLERAQQALLKNGTAIPYQPSSSPPDVQDSSNEGEEFNAVGALEKISRKSLRGEFGTFPIRMTDPGLRVLKFPEIEPSSALEHPIPSTDVRGLRLAHGRTSETYGAELNGNAAQSRASFGRSEKNDLPRQQTELCPETDTAKAPSQASFLSGGMFSESSQAYIHSPDSPSSEGATFMQVDSNPHPPSDPASHARDGLGRGQNQAFDPALLAYEDSPFDANVFNATSDTSGSSTCLRSVPNYSQSQEQSNSASDSQSFFSSLSPSELSPRIDFDFDVSYDMRASTGPENFLPLLPQGMDAWRAILEDSRFFGFGAEIPEGERTTPR